MLTADYYGKIQFLGIEVDGYVLSNGLACLSERGAVSLLGFSTPSVLERVYSNSWPKELKPFISSKFECTQTLVKVTATCPHKGSNIRICDAATINTIARAYSRAYFQGKLRKNQIHIGLHCASLRDAMADAALEQVIYDGCGYNSKQTLSQRAEKSYVDAVELLQEFGFTCSVPNDIATKKDLTSFLKVPQSTLNGFLSKHSYEIKPIKLDSATIRSLGYKAKRMNGYPMSDVVKIVMGMDTEITASIKDRMFGDLGTFVKMDSRGEIQWREILRKVFAGFELLTNHPVGKYRYYVDYFVPQLLLCLEENGFGCHKNYDRKKEQEREKAITEEYALIRFHQKISSEVLFNAILKAKPGDIIKLYDVEQKNLVVSAN